MTQSEENYLKIIYHLSSATPKGVNTNAIALMMATKASSVTDMLKKLADKGLLDYQKYYGVTLTPAGLYEAKMIIRKHRLWEVFLVKKLGFTWDEVHDIAEELEHIQSVKLINKLDAFLDFPVFDPHGDPIPNQKGEIMLINKLLLCDAQPRVDYVFVGVKDSSSEFLQYLDKQKITLGNTISILSKEVFDNSLCIQMNQIEMSISSKISENLFVKIKDS